MRARTKLVACLLAANLCLPASGALAQAEVCINPNTGQIDQQATEGWNLVAQSADARLMGQLTGAWYTEITNPYTGQVDFHTTIYEANGAFQYQSQVCDASRSFCSPFSGHGVYAARDNGNGTIMIFSIVSDMSRDRVCGASTVQLIDANRMVDSNGQQSMRVQ